MLAGHLSLAVIGVLNSLLSVIYYLRVIVAMYMEEGGAEGKRFVEAPQCLCRDSHRRCWHALPWHPTQRRARLEPNRLCVAGISPLPS